MTLPRSHPAPLPTGVRHENAASRPVARAHGPAVHHSPHHAPRPRRDHGTRFIHPRLEAVLLLLLFAAGVIWALGLTEAIRTFRAAGEPGSAVAAPVGTDADGDGLPDAEEDALLVRYAPRGLLDRADPSYPANIEWVRHQTGLSTTGPNFMGAMVASHPFSSATRRGSHDRRDWTVYGHAYPRKDGGIELQYWFYYPYNEGPLFFDHESDWEHVSVELDAARQPRTFALAAHNHNAPGVRVPWERAPRDGEHPWFVIASGTHAAYLRGPDAPFWERAIDCPRDAAGRPALDGCAVDVIQPGAPLSGDGATLVNVGERGHPRLDGDPDAFFMTYAGMWGAAAPAFGTAAPYGPPYQRGFCVDAAPGSCR